MLILTLIIVLAVFVVFTFKSATWQTSLRDSCRRWNCGVSLQIYDPPLSRSFYETVFL